MTASPYKYLYQVDSPRDLRRLSPDELRAYCGELRHFIIEQLSANPGHLGSSLGVVELAAALHYVFDTPNDKLIWDVGHQAYAHKIITGRRDRFLTNRKLNGLSGFPSMSESEYDAFGTGHASTSISAALGMAAASALRGEKRVEIPVIRDGALAGELPGAGDLYVTIFGGRTRRLGMLLGRGIPFTEAQEILKGVTLEAVVIITRVARALRARGENPDYYPLLFHMDAILNDGAEVDLPWSKFGR